MLNYASHAFGAQAGWGFGDGMMDDGCGKPRVHRRVRRIQADGRVLPRPRRGRPHRHGLDDRGERRQRRRQRGGEVRDQPRVRRVRFGRHGDRVRAGAERDRRRRQLRGPADRPARRPRRPGVRAAQLLERLHAELRDQGLRELPRHPAVPRLALLQPGGPRTDPLGRRSTRPTPRTPPARSPSSRSSASTPTTSTPRAPTDIQKDLGWSNAVFADSTESRALKESYNAPDVRAVHRLRALHAARRATRTRRPRSTRWSSSRPRSTPPR